MPLTRTTPQTLVAVHQIRNVSRRAPRRALRLTGTLLLAVLASGMPDPEAIARAAPQTQPPSTARHFAIPISLLEEHAELYTAFESASRMPGQTGAAARRVAALREPHVAKEQRIAYPLLRLLPMLAPGGAEPWMEDLLPLADRLRAELPALKREHVTLREALETLKTAAWTEGHQEYAFLVDRLNHHIRIEEETLYPAALVTAECVRARLAH